MQIITKIRAYKPLVLFETGLIVLTTYEDEWESQEWLADARNLVNWANSIEHHVPIMILVRHSHREHIRTLKEMSETGITPLGEAMARELGQRLNHGRIVEIHHSFIPRCEQTAHEIAAGIRDAGGKVVFVRPFDLLVGPNVKDMKLWEKVGDDGTGVDRFVNSWESGEFGDRIESFVKFSKRLRAGLLNRFKRAKPSSMHLYVTHDLFLMVARRTFLNEKAHIAQRPPYLGGYAMSMTENQTVFYEARTGQSSEMSE